MWGGSEYESRASLGTTDIPGARYGCFQGAHVGDYHSLRFYVGDGRTRKLLEDDRYIRGCGAHRMAKVVYRTLREEEKEAITNRNALQPCLSINGTGVWLDGHPGLRPSETTAGRWAEGICWMIAGKVLM